MTNNEILNLSRVVLDDTKTPYLWQDDELNVYLSKAIREFAALSKIIIDDETVEDADSNPICIHAIDVDAVGYTGSITLHPCIVEVLNVWFTDTTVNPNRTYELEKITSRIANMFGPSNWQTLSSANPTGYILDKKSKTLRLYYKPSVDGIVTLNVIRTPFVEPKVTEPDVVSELDPTRHLALIDYIAFKAYLKNDSETYNPNKAKEHLGLFMSEVEKAKREHLMFISVTENIRPLDGNL